MRSRVALAKCQASLCLGCKCVPQLHAEPLHARRAAPSLQVVKRGQNTCQMGRHCAFCRQGGQRCMPVVVPVLLLAAELLLRKEGCWGMHQWQPSQEGKHLSAGRTAAAAVHRLPAGTTAASALC